MKYITILIPLLVALSILGLLAFVVWLDKLFGGDDNDLGNPSDFYG